MNSNWLHDHVNCLIIHFTNLARHILTKTVLHGGLMRKHYSFQGSGQANFPALQKELYEPKSPAPIEFELTIATEPNAEMVNLR